MNWEIVKLGDYIDTLKGFAFKSAGYSMDGVPIVRVSNFTTDSISFDDIKYYSKEDTAEYNRYRLNPFDVLVQTVGSWQNNPNSVVGKVVCVPSSFSGALLNQNIVKLIPLDSDCLDNRFLFYRLKNNDFKQHNLGNAVGAANQASITLDTIRAFTFMLPPIKIQRQIANILSSYDDLIENNHKQIRLLEEATMKLYKEWFVNLRFPGYENTTILSGVPDGWQRQYFDKIFTYVRGKSYSSDELSEKEGVLLVNLKNICAYGGYNRNFEKKFTGAYKENQTVKSGDVVMAVTDMTQERRLVGHVAMIPKLKTQAIISMDLIKLVPYNVSNYFLYSTLRFGNFGKEISQYANGVNVLHLKPDVIKNLEMLTPHENIIRKFDEIVKNYFQRIEVLENQIELSKQARDELLPKLMNGEIEV